MIALQQKCTWGAWIFDLRLTQNLRCKIDQKDVYNRGGNISNLQTFAVRILPEVGSFRTTQFPYEG